MELLQLVRYSEFKALIVSASNRTGRLYRFFFASRLAKFVHRVKEDYKTQFAVLYSPQLFKPSAALNIFSTLDYSSPGRVIANLAFLAYLLDLWDSESGVRSEFAIDSLCFPSWLMLHKTQLQSSPQNWTHFELN
ncbi:E1B 19K [Bovine adenovirus 10]|uniref:E1B protein, small T-antigen n=1 Tax=Bovine adenovirus C serotype 10 TaxID=39788 RepID=A0A9X9KRU2_ADEBA|nr:E1B 19K [Bovine adenovirus 10]